MVQILSACSALPEDLSSPSTYIRWFTTITAALRDQMGFHGHLYSHIIPTSAYLNTRTHTHTKCPRKGLHDTNMCLRREELCVTHSETVKTWPLRKVQIKQVTTYAGSLSSPRSLVKFSFSNAIQEKWPPKYTSVLLQADEARTEASLPFLQAGLSYPQITLCRRHHSSVTSPRSQVCWLPLIIVL